MPDPVRYEARGSVALVTIDRYEARNAVDSGETGAGAMRFAQGTGRHGSFDEFRKRD